MNLKDYLSLKAKPYFKPHRSICLKCRKASLTCYCDQIVPFETEFEFVILIHPRESRNSIGTGRFTHLCISNSHFIEGENFTHHLAVNALIEDESFFNVVLYPGEESLDISKDGAMKIAAILPQNKKLRIFVIDGTWASARKILRLSDNLKQLPQICFTPPHLSCYRIRKQPDPVCFSTVEAVHFMIGHLSLNKKKQAHQNLLDVFSFMVEQQLSMLDKAVQSGKLKKRAL